MRSEKGITLVALILIIVVLVALAGISITLVFQNETEKERANKPQPEEKSQQEIYEEYEHLLNQNLIEDESSTITDSIASFDETEGEKDILIDGNGSESQEPVNEIDESKAGIVTKISNTAGNYVVEEINVNEIPSSGTNSTEPYNPNAR